MDQCGFVSIEKAESKGETGEKNIMPADCTEKGIQLSSVSCSGKRNGLELFKM